MEHTVDYSEDTMDYWVYGCYQLSFTVRAIKRLRNVLDILVEDGAFGTEVSDHTRFIIDGIDSGLEMSSGIAERCWERLGLGDV